jgi:NADH-quinone oxidoreductase subunit J
VVTPIQGVFLLTALAAVLSALMVVTAPKLVHAALWLIATLGSVAVLFILLDAAFLAMVQVVVYIGAIAILIIFTVMLTRRVMTETGPQVNRLWWLATFVAAVMFAALVGLLAQVPSWWSATPGVLGQQAAVMVQELGQSLVDLNRYVIPFEVASVLLLAALIGSIVLARPSNDGPSRGERN